MPHENFHSSHLAHKPGETVTPSGIILPAGVGRPRNVGQTISMDQIQQDAQALREKAENPYDQFVLRPKAEVEAEAEAASQAEVKAEAETESPFEAYDKALHEVLVENESLRRQLAARDQEIEVLKSKLPEVPEELRRVRKVNGVTEKLHKYSDGSYVWMSKDENDEYTIKSDIVDTVDPVDVVAPSADTAKTPDVAPDPTPDVVTSPDTDDTDDSVAAPAVASVAVPPVVPSNPDVSSDTVQDVAPAFEVKVSDDLEKALGNAQDNYAAATAKARNGLLGHLLYNSKTLAMIPGLQKIADRINTAVDDKSLNPARQEYKVALEAVLANIKDQYTAEFGNEAETFEKIRMEAMDVAIQSELALEMKIAESRMKQSGKTNKFINWWVRQDGLGGKLRKAAVVAGAGLSAGVVAGLAGAPLIVGAVAGGTVGAIIGKDVSKKRASGFTEKDGTQTLAYKQQYEDLAAKSQYVNEQKATSDATVTADSLIGFTDERTANERAGNRARVGGAAVAGGIGGSFGVGIGAAARTGLENLVDGRNETADAGTPPPEAPGDGGETTPPAKAPPELQGQSFNVESGNGYTQELVDFAQANGRNLSPDQSLQLHQDLVAQFGGDYIDIGAPGNDVYEQGGELMLNEPGAATWADGVAPYIDQWMAARGL